MALFRLLIEFCYAIKSAVKFHNHFTLVRIFAEPVKKHTQRFDIRFKSVRIDKAIDQTSFFPKDLARFLFPSPIGRRQRGGSTTDSAEDFPRFFYPLLVVANLNAILVFVGDVKA
jgi:hypothetical protein